MLGPHIYSITFHVKEKPNLTITRTRRNMYASLESESSKLKMLIYVSGQDVRVYQLCTFLILHASQHQFTPAPVHSTRLIWFSLIASSLKGPAALAAGDQPGVKWSWPPSPVLMAGKGDIQTTAATAWRYIKWGRNPETASYSSF